jgi:hypothetical protein
LSAAADSAAAAAPEPVAPELEVAPEELAPELEQMGLVQGQVGLVQGLAQRMLLRSRLLTSEMP